MEPANLDEIYRKLPADEIPWNLEEPPGVLVKFVESGKVRPCRAVDLGCGTGTSAIYLAEKGFDVTGIDSAPTAIRMAREKAERKGVKCSFVVADLLGDLTGVKGPFEFAFDWELLHHLMPGDRGPYMRNLASLLEPGAHYLSVCFSEEDPQFGGTGKIRRTRIGTVLYFSSEAEIRDLLAPYFLVRDLKTIEISGKWGPHRAICAFSERR